MEYETKRAMIIAAAIIALAIIVILVGTLVFSPKSKAEPTSPESASAAPSPSADAGSDGAPDSGWLAGIKDAESLKSLDSKEAATLEKAVKKWGSYNYVDVGDLAVMKDDPDDPGGRAIIFKVGEKERYIVAQEVEDGVWSVIKLTRTVEGVNENAPADAWDRTQTGTVPENVDISQQDRFTPATELTTKSMTIDPNDTWPVTYKQAAEYVPASILNQLQGDVNDWLAPSGKSIDDAVNIMVCKNGVVQNGSEYEFYVLALVGADKPVFKCVYDKSTATGTLTHIP